VSIKGWAVGAAATERIQVLLDDHEIGEAGISLERHDIGNLFPALAHARRAGFAFRHSGDPVSAGEHLIVLRHRADGEETDVLLPVLAIEASTADAQPAASPGTTSRDVLLNIDRPEVVDGETVVTVRGDLEIAGWALARKGLASIDIAIDGQTVKSVGAGIHRRDVQRVYPDWEGAATGGFSALLPKRSLEKGPHQVCVTVQDRAGLSARSEFRIEVDDVSDVEGPWTLRRRMKPAEITFRARPILEQSSRPSFAVIMPLPAGAEALQAARVTLASLSKQVYESWTLWIFPRDNEDQTPWRGILDGFEELTERVDLVSGERTERWLQRVDSVATHLMVVRPGDELGCDALLEYAARTILDPEADFIYPDERRSSPYSGKVEAFFKPQWSPDLLLSQNYLGHAWCARTDIFRRARISGGELANTCDFDLALRLTEQAGSIRHLALTLLQAAESQHDEALERKALERALKRRGIAATVKSGRVKGTFRVQRKLTTRGLVSIVIPTCASRGLIRKCIETLRALTAYRRFEIICIENISSNKTEWKDWLRAHADRVIETTEPFNWSRFNNLAAATARGEFLLFLNDDIEIIDRGWLEAMLEQAQRSDVGVVGAQLLYPDHRVQHAGMFLACLGVARHAFRYADENAPGYFGLALTQREVIAVTGACLMTRRETFEALGGFDETHDVINNDVDYCLRIWQKGLRSIYTPHARLIHHELASRSEVGDSYNTAGFEGKWRSVFVSGDPFFNPRLTKERDDYSIEWEPVEAHCAGYPVFAHTAIRRILVVKLDHIGDCVISLPAVRRLKLHFPAATLSVLTGRASKAVWALEPAVDEVIEFDLFHARSALGLVERTEEDWDDLRQRLSLKRFDLAVDLRRHGESRPILRYTGARYLAGFDSKGKFPWLDIAIEAAEDSALLHKRQHTADDLVNLADAVGAAGEENETVLSLQRGTIAVGDLAGVPNARRIFCKRVVCVHPAVGNEMRQWPPEYFGVLINQLIELENIHIIIIGAPEDAELGETVLKGVVNRKAVWSLIGKVKLNALPALLARCALFVGNNSGPQHIAAGLGVPTVGIHSGVVDAREWGPRGPNAIALQRAMTCSPCYHARLEDCGRALACLRGLLPAEAVAACQHLLAAPMLGTNNRGLSQPVKHSGAIR
jgi:ADP-heptose:LPS heptosyltransferase/GT2 family glycosyltransferase